MDRGGSLPLVVNITRAPDGGDAHNAARADAARHAAAGAVLLEKARRRWAGEEDEDEIDEAQLQVIEG
jgi:hypothetical protein